MSKKQTAIQELIEVLTINAGNILPMDIDDIIILLESKYLQLEREQIVDTFKHAQALHAIDDDTRAEQYYTQTHGKCTPQS